MFETHNSVEAGQLRAWHYDDSRPWPFFIVLEVERVSTSSYVKILEDGMIRTLRMGDVMGFSIDAARMEGQAWSK
jgi:hypothetical protein